MRYHPDCIRHHPDCVLIACQLLADRVVGRARVTAAQEAAGTLTVKSVHYEAEHTVGADLLRPVPPTHG